MRRSSDWVWALWLLLGAPLFLMLAGVPVRLMLDSSSWKELTTPATLQALRVSAWTSFTALLCTIAFGTPLAWSLARGRFPLRRVAEALVELPVVLPPAAAGIGLLMLFGYEGWIGRELNGAGISVVFTPLAVIFAQLFVGSPLYVRSASSAFAHIDRELEFCAHLDGASRIQVLWHVGLPLARRGLIGGLLLCWARALGEFGATILFAGNFEGRTQTMPLAIYAGFEQDLSAAVALARALLLIALAVLLVAKLVDR